MDQPHAERGQQAVFGVQVLRAFAALAVVVHHSFNETNMLAQATGRSFVASELFPWQAGVDIFFVISGFIMVYASERLFARADAPRTFLLRRIIRVVPIYWLVTMLFLAIMWLIPGTLNSGRPTADQIIQSLLFIPYARPDGLAQPIYTLGWTLNYEMYFYALFGMAIVWPRAKAVAAVTLFLALAVLIGRLVALPQPLAFWADPIVFEFVFGMGIAMLVRRGVVLASHWRASLSILALALLAADLTQLGESAWSRLLGWGVPAALLVAAAVLTNKSLARSPPRWERPLVALGDATYSVYLIHPFVFRALSVVVNATHIGPNVPLAVFMVGAVLLSTVAGVMTYRLIERPITAGLRRLIGF